MRILSMFFALVLSCCASKVDCSNPRLKGELVKGLPNNVIITSNKKILNVSIDKGTIEKTDENNYCAIPNADNSCRISVKLRKTTKEFNFKIKKLAPSVMSFGGEIFTENDSISAPRFRVSRPNIVVSPDFVCNDFNLDIIHMTVIRIDKNKTITREEVTEMYSDLVHLAEFGDTYIFTDIEYKFHDLTNIFQCPTTLIKIKN